MASEIRRACVGSRSWLRRHSLGRVVHEEAAARRHSFILLCSGPSRFRSYGAGGAAELKTAALRSHLSRHCITFSGICLAYDNGLRSDFVHRNSRERCVFHRSLMEA